MTQVEQYKGKLGFETRRPDALSTGSAAAVDTLEEYGHSVRHFQSRSPNLIVLECDHYRIDLRYRRHPIKQTEVQDADNRAHETPLRSSLGVTFVPLYPDHCDEELSEMLLAVTLERLVEELEATTVHWLDVPFAMSADTFLGAFEGDEDAALDTMVGQQAAPIAAPLTAKEQPRPQMAEAEETAHAPLPADILITDVVAKQAPIMQIAEPTAEPGGVVDHPDSAIPDDILAAVAAEIAPTRPRLSQGLSEGLQGQETDRIWAEVDARLDQAEDAAADAHERTVTDFAAEIAGCALKDADHAALSRPKGRACFQPIEQTAEQLSQHCEEILQELPQDAPESPNALTRDARARARARTKALLDHASAQRRGIAGWLDRLSGLSARMMATPTFVLRNEASSGTLRSAFIILCGATALLALQSSAAIAF